MKRARTNPKRKLLSNVNVQDYFVYKSAAISEMASAHSGTPFGIDIWICQTKLQTNALEE